MTSSSGRSNGCGSGNVVAVVIVVVSCSNIVVAVLSPYVISAWG